MAQMFDQSTRLPEATYVVAVRTIYATLMPSLIMAGAFLCIGTLIAVQTRDQLLNLFFGAGALALIMRLGVLFRFRAEVCSPAFEQARARRVERAFAIPYLAFALTFGAFSARALQVASVETHMLVMGLVFGFAAGVAAGIFLRPWIALPSLALAVVPTSASVLMAAEAANLAAGGLLITFLIGGMHSTMRNYRAATAEITARAAFASIARADALTGLMNRLSLREAYDNAVAESGCTGILAVHCLDLDRFKAVNDTYGHPVGDALLKEVSVRLRRTLRTGNVAARVGGDEFVLLQTGVMHFDEAELFARRVARAIAEPYSIHGHMISIGTSVGYAIQPQDSRDLDQLIACADEALIRIKRGGGGVSAYVVSCPRARLRLSA